MSVSIIIKAWNEERHIGRAVESAIAALDGIAGEIIVADCGSTDGTTAIASRYPVQVVQLADPSERSCGIAPQLGYQHSAGEYVCLMDGDMVLHAEFLAAAIAFLRRRPDAAGVGGRINERNVTSLEFARRTQRSTPDQRPGDVDRLNGGGVFRRAAIARVGWFSDRNLHAYEEFELAARLKADGWTLHRLDCDAVDHHGHTANGYLLLWRRLRSGYVFGIGEVIRAALAAGHLRATVAGLRELRLWTAVYLWWLAMAGMVAASLALWPAALALLAAPVILMGLRYRSAALGLYAVAAWHVHALGLLIGLLRRRRAPTEWIGSRILSDRRADRLRLPARRVAAS